MYKRKRVLQMTRRGKKQQKIKYKVSAIEILPVDILRCIFALLGWSNSTYRTFCLTSKKWHMPKFVKFFSFHTEGKYIKNIRHLPFQSLTLRAFPLDHMHFAMLNNFTNLQHLTMKHLLFTDTESSLIQFPSTLTSLTIDDYDICKLNITCPNLTSLTLKCKSLIVLPFAVSALTQLQFLDVAVCEKLIVLPSLSGLPLRSLKLPRTIFCIGVLPHLEELTLEWVTEDLSVAFKALRSLTVRNEKFHCSVIYFACFSRLSSLKHLSLGCAKYVHNIDTITRLTALERLNILECVISNKENETSILQSLPNLKLGLL